MQIVRGAVALALLVACVGCSLRMGDMTALATRNVQVSPQPVRQHVEGKDCVNLLFNIIPIGSIVPNIQEAMDDALEKAPDGNAMTDIAIYSEPLFIPYLFTRNCLRVRGDVVKISGGR